VGAWVRGCVGVWVCVWVCGCVVCWDTGLLQVCRPYSLTPFIHSASLRSFTPFASPVNSDGCATPSFLIIVGLCCGYRVVGGGAPVGL